MQIVVQVQLERTSASGAVDAPRYPGVKEEFWWLVCGDAAGSVLAIKRLSCDSRHKAVLRIDNFKPGKNAFKLYFMCDSYLGCDQEYEFEVQVGGDGDCGNDDDAAPMQQD
jgi:pre-mRNA-splicing helicase BRR2